MDLRGIFDLEQMALLNSCSLLFHLIVITTAFRNFRVAIFIMKFVNEKLFKIIEPEHLICETNKGNIKTTDMSDLEEITYNNHDYKLLLNKLFHSKDCDKYKELKKL